MIKVENIVQIYEVAGKENKDKQKVLKISNHWNRNNFVNIELNEFSKITVSANDLEAEIQNAKNSNRF